MEDVSVDLVGAHGDGAVDVGSGPALKPGDVSQGDVSQGDVSQGDNALR